MDQVVRFDGHITAEQVRRSPYLYLPFPVPPRTRRIDVSYSYPDPATAPLGMGPGNNIDIGIFDSRGYDFLTAPGFRGWSGASRREFFISPREATQGYIRGPLFPGEWNIILGAYRANPDGVPYEVTVRLDIADEDQPVEEGELPVLTGGHVSNPSAGQVSNLTGGRGGGPARWVKGDLHCHTLHSDGANSVEEMVRHAIEKGLDFLAVTDHNTITHFEDLDRLSGLPITLIPGEEITTYWGHANTWGLREWVEFRCADDESIKAVQRYLREKDALVSINHAKCMGPPWLFKGWDGFPAMEVWQAPWRFHNWESLERWDRLLESGERVTAVGGSDVHSIPPAAPRQPHGLAEPATWVYVEDGGPHTGRPAEQSVLDAIRAGHVFITDAPNGAHLFLYADAPIAGTPTSNPLDSSPRRAGFNPADDDSAGGSHPPGGSGFNLTGPSSSGGSGFNLTPGGGGARSAMMGDTIHAPDGKPVRFRAEVHGGMDRKLWLVTDSGPIDIISLDKADATIDFTLDITRHRYLRAELRGFRGRPERGEVVWAMTNPIWFDNN